MTKTRRWRWVTRDEGTEYEDTVSIWPGVRRPRSRKWDSLNARFARPLADDAIDYQQEQGQSIDIDWEGFRHMFNCHVQRGEVLKVEFSLKVQP